MNVAMVQRAADDKNFFLPRAVVEAALFGNARSAEVSGVNGATPGVSTSPTT